MHYMTKSFLFMGLIFILYLFSPAEAQQASVNSINTQFAKLETAADGRLGVYAINTANHTSIAYRAQERFPMQCTSKVMGVSAILYKSMSEPGLLQQKITYKKDQLVSWSPITEKHLSDGMTVTELCSAAITLSDNTAMDLLAEQLGGIQKINAFANSIGDHTFRLDHNWPKEAESGGTGNVDDSSTPYAMGKSLQRLALSNVLAPAQRMLLLTWMKNNFTGSARIRAGVPKGWVVADKTGTGIYYGTTNDIGIIWPPHRAPIIIVIFFTQDHNRYATMHEKIVAAATRIILNKFMHTSLPKN